MKIIVMKGGKMSLYKKLKLAIFWTMAPTAWIIVCGSLLVNQNIITLHWNSVLGIYLAILGIVYTIIIVVHFTH